MAESVHQHTPTLIALDGAGREVRRVAYYRAEAGLDAQARIARQAFNKAGLVAAAWDARRTFPQQPGQAYTYSLSGRVVYSDSVDAGYRILRYTVAGEPNERWDSQGTRWLTEYDLLSRPVTVSEFAAGQRRVTDRFTYANADVPGASRNQCGRLIRHDDGAGAQLIADYALRGDMLAATRHFATDMAPSDWPLSEADRDAKLEAGPGSTTHWTVSPLGQHLEQLDAGGHRQRFSYDLAGQLASLTVQTRDGEQRIALQSMTYNAQGQVEQHVMGNGVVCRNRHDPADGRLIERVTTQADRTLLQSLAYRYDPVGNVVWLEDEAQPIRHFANRQVRALSVYAYDTLGQLIEASGREAAGNRIPHGLPPLSLPTGDSHQLVNYFEHYDYDAGGNLTRLRHTGVQSYTRQMQVSAHSNRSLVQIEDHDEARFDAFFDKNGNVLTLENGQAMQWNPSNQLQSVVLLARADNPADVERYTYGGDGQRVRKQRTAQAKQTSHVKEVRYLPGLEMHVSDSEQLEVVTLHVGPFSARLLHWNAGKPDEIDNDQVRFSLTDQLNSCTLEVDHRGKVLSHEGYYPYGATAWWACKSQIQASYKTLRYSGKERDASGLYYYGFRYYAPWLQRWISPDPAGPVDGLNLYKMVGNSPLSAIDPDGLMLRHIAKGAAGAAYAGYQLSKMDDKPKAGPAPSAAAPPSRGITPGEAQANQWLDKSRQHVVEAKDKVTGAFAGRLAAAYNLAHGKVPGAKAVLTGAEVTAEAVQVAAHGDVAQIDKTSLAKSAVVDTYKNLGSVIEAGKKAVHTTAVVATLPTDKKSEIQSELQRRTDETTAGLTTSLATGVAVAGALDTAATLAPPGPIKLGLIGASFAWKATGIVHTAEELTKIAEQHKDLISNEFGKDLNAQVTAINQQKRSELIDKLGKRAA